MVAFIYSKVFVGVLTLFSQKTVIIKHIKC